MTDSPPHTDPPAAANPADRAALPPLQLDPDKYREHLVDMDLTEAQENELLEVLWNIMKSFVELGFGLNSVQLLPGMLDDEKTRGESDDTLEARDLAAQFTTASDEHRASGQKGNKP